MYYRLYLTQLLLGYLFNLDDSNVSRVISRVRPLLLEVLPVPVQETLLFASDEQKGRKRIATLDELFKRHPEFKEVLIDATEQETPKPQDRVKRRGHYSGKKKRHTSKTQITTTPGGLFLHISHSIAGRVNDLTLLRGSGVLRELPAEIDIRLDRARLRQHRTRLSPDALLLTPQSQTQQTARLHPKASQPTTEPLSGSGRTRLGPSQALQALSGYLPWPYAEL
jgi:hypothetical protein